MDLTPLIEQSRSQLADIEQRLAAFDFSDTQAQDQYRELSQEHDRLTRILQAWNEMQTACKELAEARELLEQEDDEAFQEEAQREAEKQQKVAAEKERQIKTLLLPSSGDNEQRNTIVEIRPAAGGEEATLFAADLLRMYTRFAEAQGWQCEILTQQESDVGGIKEAIFSLQGENSHRLMRYESGVHRVQRVPETESSGRIHTSTITVAVLREAREVEININPQDIRTDVFRASGPGGQSVNTTDSAVRMTHVPTGITVSCQNEKSQHKNRNLAMRILRSRLFEKKQADEEARHAQDRRQQVGSGERSERIRTYNFPQNRVSDHRFNITRHDLENILEGNLEALLNQIVDLDVEQRLQASLDG